MNTINPLYKEREQNLAEGIWFALLFSFVFDPVLAAYPPLKFLLLNSHSQYLLSALLFAGLILNSKESLFNLSFKINQIQSQSRRGSKHALILCLFIAGFVFLELFNHFGALIFQNAALLLIVIAVAGISIVRSFQDKRRHDLLMESDRTYFIKQQSIQNMLISLLPAFFSRTASLIAAVDIYNLGSTFNPTVLYFLSLILFFASHPISSYNRTNPPEKRPT